MLRDRVPKGRYADYEIKIVMLPLADVTAPVEYYWHLFFKGRKINGGITEDWDKAHERATQYRFDHHRTIWMMDNIWDEETQRWESMGNVIM